jgi:DnaK suppressor protein
VISTRLRDVHAALGRINVGTFGLCLECDDELSPKRLAAVPWASLCIRCQEAEDGREREGYRVALPLAA